MLNRWRTAGADMPPWSVPLLWCLLLVAVAAIVAGVVGLVTHSPVPGRPNLPWPAALIDLGVPILVVSLWGLYFRRFAFGTAWIAVTLTVAGLVAGGFVAIVAADARGKDSIGHGLVLIFCTPILFITLIVASSIMYGVYWRRKFRRAVRESRDELTRGSHP